MEPSALPTLVPISFKFLELINKKKPSSIFKIEYDGKPYALKVVSILVLWNSAQDRTDVTVP